MALTSHTNNQTLIQNAIVLEGTAGDNSGILEEIRVNGGAAVLKPYVPAGGQLAYHWRAVLTLKAGGNLVTALARDASGNKASQSITLQVGQPTSVQLTDFHLTQRGIMRTNSNCDLDTPLVAGKFTIVRARFEARTASGAESYVDGVLLTLWRRNGAGADVCM